MRSTPNSKYVDNMKLMLSASAFRQIFFMLGIAISVAVGISLYNSIREPNYQPIDYHITDKNMTAIIDVLDKSHIHYKINQQDGIVLIPVDEMETAKIKLSTAGISKDDGFSFSFLNEQNALSNSQFIESARYIRALEADLSKTINSIEGVSGVRVHIAVPRNNVFADENNKVTASIVLNVSAAFLSNKEKVRSIIQIIADSVPGLDPKDIAVTDQYGHFLSDGLDQNSIYNVAQLSYQNNVQSYYEKRIESMIVPILGENKVVVRVNAQIDFTQQENAQESYDPDKKAILSEQSNTEENNSGGASGAPGSLSNSPPDDRQPNAGGPSGGGQKRSQNMKNYNVSKTITYNKSNVAKVKSLSVAVIVDNEMILDPQTHKQISKAIPKDKIDKITELVKTVIGFEPKRGDKVTVINSVYSPVAELTPSVPLKLWENPWFWDAIKKIVGVLLGFLFLFIVYRKLSTHLTAMRQVKPKNIFVPSEEDADDENNIARMTKLKKQGIEQLKEMAVSEPTKVASIIKNWIRK